MDAVQARTFLAVVRHGSFIAAARQLHVTQSTVSARMRALEESLGAELLVRNRAGARLTAAGRRLVRHARNLVRTVDQARQDVGASHRFDATLRVGGRIALWEDLLPRWVACLRAEAPGLALVGEIGFEDPLTTRVLEGSLDIAVLYTPRYHPALAVEPLFDDTLVLVSTRAEDESPERDYVYVDWGPGFRERHRAHCESLEHPAMRVNIGWLGLKILQQRGGSCYLPLRMAAPWLEAGRLHRVDHAPCFAHPAYVVHDREGQAPPVAQALAALRRCVAAAGIS